MAQLILNVGTNNNDKTGDTLRAGGLKIKSNFAEIYNALSNDGLNISGGNLLKTGGWSDIRNKPNFVALATSGQWNDISGKPNLVIQKSVPNSALGTTGHLAGDLAYDGTNLYVAIADYDGTTEIWKTIPWGGGNFPTLTTNLHNGGEQNAQTLQFGDPSQQVVITGPSPAANDNAQRLIIQGQRASGPGEGGDVYLWAGDSEVNGGDIKIYAGDADNTEAGNGGYINLEGGRGFDNGGDINITGGYSNGGIGGSVSISAGGGTGSGEVQINVSGRTTRFDVNGNTTIPGGIITGTTQTNGSGDPAYPTALSLIATVNKLSNNIGSTYTLADGAEGQIMHIVPQDGATNAGTQIIVNHGRVLNASASTVAAVYTNIALNPFAADTGTVPNVVTMIFTDGAWQSNAGIWD